MEGGLLGGGDAWRGVYMEGVCLGGGGGGGLYGGGLDGGFRPPPPGYG